MTRASHSRRNPGRAAPSLRRDAARAAAVSPGPEGGLCVGRALRRWRWRADGWSDPVRCRREEWYLLRCECCAADPPDLDIRFLDAAGRVLLERWLEPTRLAHASGRVDWLHWVQAPGTAAAFQLRATCPEPGSTVAPRLMAYDVAERDTKCHPLAVIPAWSQYKPPFPLERVVLPRALARLAVALPGQAVELVDAPTSWRAFAARAVGAAAVVDPAWIERLGVGLKDVELLAQASWLVLDLKTFADLLARAGGPALRLRTLRTAHEIMSARSEYADVATRGFALMDVFPYGVVTDSGGFAARTLQRSRDWRSYAEPRGFAKLLSAETPWTERSGDILCLSRPLAQGELNVSDVPWLAAGALGRPLAPALALHCAAMLLGAPLDDGLQYWNRWDDFSIVLRDIADLSKRWACLHPVRWASTDNVAKLAVALDARPSGRVGASGNGRPADAWHIVTGRADLAARSDGVPAEPMIILMKSLAQERQAASAWAERFLRDRVLMWQFDAADALRYATHYDSAASLGPLTASRWLRVRLAQVDAPQFRRGEPESTLVVPRDLGVFGDRSLGWQGDLARAVRAWIERK